ncbi:MAG: succinate dehydrogenase/fumarate reductase iron-sulfur subunit [Candidatus Loosdrechtia sp.]|uniref:succinate dehydrogenase/fumarate reductase iron-sulfur subunit n=1 Tax=Candidatus Loosdrechtia sp. TaxID=3101272 RepID=UPI003A721E70|nr:MAG: succinate dehydrogenase iron-sulfur subunit [Candidatus Jettenia sp. AMX2]
MKFRIYRFDSGNDKNPRYQNYTITANPTDRILDCLNRIKWEQDGTLGYRMSCGHGVCGSDAMKINGRCALACQKLVKDYQGAEVVLEPLPSYRVLKDLIVDLEPFFEKVRLLQPYLIPSSVHPEKEYQQSPDDSKKIDIAIRCILCACCMGACPVVNQNGQFLGPAPLVWAFRYIFDTRDNQYVERLKQVDYPDGVWACVNYYECTRSCPKDIPVTKYINMVKREIQKSNENS